MSTIYDFDVVAQDGSTVSLGTYKGKVLLVVNTATGCGFTPQYVGLQEMYDKFRDRGFEILDFPCNQFGNQAPGSDDEIHEFCVGRFSMTFPQFSKIDVNGKSEAPLYTWLKEQKGGIGGKKIKWNFTKFLVDREGNLVERFEPTADMADVEKSIAAQL